MPGNGTLALYEGETPIRRGQLLWQSLYAKKRWWVLKLLRRDRFTAFVESGFININFGQKVSNDN
jgi:hypothetical protein